MSRMAELPLADRAALFGVVDACCGASGQFGDRLLDLPEGVVFMHLPDRSEIQDDLLATGWTHEFDELRSRIANEPASVREFSDECRFWIARS